MRTRFGLYFFILFSFLFLLAPSSAFSTNEPPTRLLLYKTIEIGDLEKAKVILTGTDINHQDHLEYTPLYKAVFYNRLNFVEYFFELGANVNLSDIEGLAPLHVAVLENLPGMIKILKDKGPRISKLKMIMGTLLFIWLQIKVASMHHNNLFMLALM